MLPLLPTTSPRDTCAPDRQRRRLRQVQEEHRPAVAAALVQLDRVAVALPVPILAHHDGLERRLDRRAHRRLEVDALVAAPVAQQRRHLLVVVERRVHQAQLQLGAVGRVEARPLRVGRLEAIGLEGARALAALVADGVDDRIFAGALFVERLEQVAAAQIARHRQPPDERAHHAPAPGAGRARARRADDRRLERAVDLDAQPLQPRLLQLLVGGGVRRLRRRWRRRRRATVVVAVDGRDRRRRRRIARHRTSAAARAGRRHRRRRRRAGFLRSSFHDSERGDEQKQPTTTATMGPAGRLRDRPRVGMSDMARGY